MCKHLRNSELKPEIPNRQVSPQGMNLTKWATSSVPNYRSFDIFDTKFEHLIHFLQRKPQQKSDILYKFLNKTSGQNWDKKS